MWYSKLVFAQVDEIIVQQWMKKINDAQSLPDAEERSDALNDLMLEYFDSNLDKRYYSIIYEPLRKLHYESLQKAIDLARRAFPQAVKKIVPKNVNIARKVIQQPALTSQARKVGNRAYEKAYGDFINNAKRSGQATNTPAFENQARNIAERAQRDAINKHQQYMTRVHQGTRGGRAMAEQAGPAPVTNQPIGWWGPRGDWALGGSAVALTGYGLTRGEKQPNPNQLHQFLESSRQRYKPQFYQPHDYNPQEYYPHYYPQNYYTFADNENQFEKISANLSKNFIKLAKKHNMIIELGDNGLENSHQQPFPPTSECKYCGGDARIAFTAMEKGNSSEEVSKLHPNKGKGNYWLHDSGAFAVYLCKDCLEASALYNQA